MFGSCGGSGSGVDCMQRSFWVVVFVAATEIIRGYKACSGCNRHMDSIAASEDSQIIPIRVL